MKSQNVLTTDHLGLIWDALSYEFQEELSFVDGALTGASQETVLSLMQFIKSKTPNKKITINEVSYSAISLPISTNSNKTKTYYQLFLIGKKENTTQVDLYLLTITEPISSENGTSVNVEVTLNEIKLNTSTGGGNTGGGSGSSVITEDILVIGGPLADDVEENWPENWKDDSGNKIIPQGKSWEEILTGLFSKVIEGTVEWGNVSWSPNLAKPTVTLSSNGPVEVGSTITISNLTAGAATAGSRSVTCICSQGYFDADVASNVTGSHKTGNKTISVSASITGNASLTCTWNDSPINASDNLVVGEGTNTVKVTQSGQTAICEALPTTKVFAATNTKSVLPDVSATFTETKPDNKVLTSEKTDTIEGKYKYFIGCYGDSTYTDKTYTVESIRTTDNKQDGFMNGKTISTTITVPAGTKGMYIAIPEGVDDSGTTLKVKQVNTNAYVNEEMVANKRTISLTCGGTHTKDYVIFTWSFPGGTTGVEPFEITSF